MGILARFNRRQDRDSIRLSKKQNPYPVKHRLAATTTMTRTARNVTTSPSSKHYSALLTPKKLPTTTLTVTSLQSNNNPDNRIDAKMQDFAAEAVSAYTQTSPSLHLGCKRKTAEFAGDHSILVASGRPLSLLISILCLGSLRKTAAFVGAFMAGTWS